MRSAWNKGKKTSEEVRKKLSISQKKRFEKESVWNKGLKGIHLSKKSEFKKGVIPWNKGLTKKQDSRIATPWLGRKITQKMKDTLAKYRKLLVNENHPLWKGEKAGYRTKHDWIQRKLGKAKECYFDKNHKANRFHWANISGNYLRDVSDWVSLCPKCHKQFDDLVKGKIKYGQT